MKDTLKEADHQKLIFEWAALNCGKYPELRFMYHTPNGGSRNVIEAVNLKAQGVRSGVPDICLPVPKGKYHGLYIELKRYGGKPTAEQLDYIAFLKSQGYYAEWICGNEMAIEAIKWYLGGTNV